MVFVRRFFLIHTKVVQKAIPFLNYAESPTTWLSRFAKSISELPGIFVGKQFANKEITPAALVPKIAV